MYIGLPSIEAPRDDYIFLLRSSNFAYSGITLDMLSRRQRKLSEEPEMADTNAGGQKAVSTKVEQLRPGTSGHTVTLKVVSSKLVMQRGRGDGPQGRQMRLAECLVGDDTGIIVFTARGDQVDLMKPGATVILRNAKIDMFKGSMRLAVDKWGRIEVTEPADFEPKEDNNLSLIEFELINVVDG